MNPAERDLLFVYGTLRCGGSNHSFLRACEFVGKALTVEEYALYADRVPYVFKEQRVSRIVGELWAVDPASFARIDELEEHPFEYARERVGALLTHPASPGCPLYGPTLAWIYFHPFPRGILLPSGDYAERLERWSLAIK